MSDDRQAALLLHGLVPEDRAWVLDRLDPPSRDQLQQHLHELAALGIPAEPDWLALCQQSRPQAASGTVLRAEARGAVHADHAGSERACSEAACSDAAGTAQAPVAGASAQQMQAVLQGEPVWLVHTVLQLRNWPWKQDFLALQTPARQRLLQQPGPAGLSATLVAALLGRLTQRLQDSRAMACAPVPQNRAALSARRPWATLQQWLGQWL